MTEKEKLIQELSTKVEQLSRNHLRLTEELKVIQLALNQLRQEQSAEIVVPVTKEKGVTRPLASPETNAISPAPHTFQPTTKPQTALEEFIGTNLLNKIGIAILVIGIGFGAKYAIDRDMINEIMRIILGYVAGAILLGLAFRLKPKYLNFSAVLLSGGMAVLYFITFVAFDFYDLLPRLLTFALMVIFTVFTVLASMRYNTQIIAIIGLVGAYAIPFLLSDGSGNVAMLFTYMSIINTGILVLAFNRTWKGVYYLAFFTSWLIFSSWFAFTFEHESHLWISLVFATLFFLVFHITFLTYKLLRQEPLTRWDVVLSLMNSFIYFGLGYATISDHPEGHRFLGLFTVFTAFLHLITSVVAFRLKDRSRNIFYFALGLVLVFLTLAVPIQFDGNWVTFIWIGEGALLFWIGRTRQFPTYEKVSYPLMMLAVISLLHDWTSFYPTDYYTIDVTRHIPFVFNIQFLTTLWVGGALLSIAYINYKAATGYLYSSMNIILPVMTFLVFYFGIFYEISLYWNQRYIASQIPSSDETATIFNYDLLSFKTIWLLLYSAISSVLLAVFNLRFNQKDLAIKAGLAFNFMIIILFVSVGLMALAELRESFMSEDLTDHHTHGYLNIIIRYISFAAILALLWVNHRYLASGHLDVTLRPPLRIFFHFVILVMASNELIHWLELGQVTESDKLALSILWGCYALFLIIKGIMENQKYLRIAGITLFGFTLIKLFFYDMSEMSTIAKTLVMIILGALLLVASYLYNKNKVATDNKRE